MPLKERKERNRTTSCQQYTYMLQPKRAAELGVYLVQGVSCRRTRGVNHRLGPVNRRYAACSAAFDAGRKLSPGVEVSRPGVEGVELLSRDRGVEACRGLSRPVEACRGLSRLGPCLSVSRCRGVVSRVSSGSSGSSGCRVLSRCLASKVSRYPRWQDAVAAHNKTWAAAAKLFHPA